MLLKLLLHVVTWVNIVTWLYVIRVNNVTWVNASYCTVILRGSYIPKNISNLEKILI